MANKITKQQKLDNKQLTNDSIYNGNQKQVHQNGNNENDNQKYDNNSKKFAFLAQQTIPDYRPQQINDKNQKTTTNQSTKFHQLQAIFGHQGANIKDIANLQNNLLNSRNSSLENLEIINSENEVSLTKYIGASIRHFLLTISQQQINSFLGSSFDQNSQKKLPIEVQLLNWRIVV